jgi:hypothetical protein
MPITGRASYSEADAQSGETVLGVSTAGVGRVGARRATDHPIGWAWWAHVVERAWPAVRSPDIYSTHARIWFSVHIIRSADEAVQPEAGTGGAVKSTRAAQPPDHPTVGIGYSVGSGCTAGAGSTRKNSPARFSVPSSGCRQRSQPVRTARSAAGRTSCALAAFARSSTRVVGPLASDPWSLVSRVVTLFTVGGAG